MVIQPRVLVEQAEHRTHQTQRTPSATARRHPPQQGRRLCAWSQQQATRQADYDQQRDGHEGKEARPRGDLLHPRLGKPPPPFRIAKAGLTARSVGILRHRFDCGIGPIGHQRPYAPFPGRLPLPAHGDPQGLWAPGTGGQTAQRPATRMARKPQRAARVPGAIDLDLGAPFDADDTGHAQRRQQAEERDIGTAPIRRHADAPGSGGAEDTMSPLAG